jgi:hypothetical protein
VVLVFKPPIHPPLVGVLDPTDEHRPPSWPREEGAVGRRWCGGDQVGGGEERRGRSVRRQERNKYDLEMVGGRMICGRWMESDGR